MKKFWRKHNRILFSPYATLTEAVSVGEILFLVLIFAGVLYLLFPRETLEQKVLKERQNNDLAIVYLENMLKFNPENYKLLFHFADMHFQQKHFQQGHFKVIEEMVMRLLHAYDPRIRAGALKLGDNIFKRQYFLIKDPHQRKRLVERNSRLLEQLLLSSEDVKYQSDLLTYVAESGTKAQYIELIKKLAQKDPVWQEKLAEYYIAHDALRQGFATYVSMLADAGNKARQKALLLRTLKVAMYGSYFKEGRIIAQRYESAFVDDDEVFEAILRFYLAAGEQQHARAYALKRKRY